MGSRNIATTDQLTAAVRDAMAGMFGAAKLLNVPVNVGRDPVNDKVVTNLLGDHPKACSHAHKGPRPMYVTAAQKGRTVCAKCFDSPGYQRLLHAWTQTRDCDACGRDSDKFHESITQLGPLTVVGHVCPACRQKAYRHRKSES